MSKKVYTLWIAERLCDQGFKIIDILPNVKKPWLKVYVFEVVPGFQKAFENIVREGRGKHGKL